VNGGAQLFTSPILRRDLCRQQSGYPARRANFLPARLSQHQWIIVGPPANWTVIVPCSFG
jgi:hypothetical protein